LSSDLCERHLRRLLDAELPGRTLWIDMEGSSYVERTIAIYKRVLRDYHNTGLCLQAYLPRTALDLAALLPERPSIRLVKGAYREPAGVAFEDKSTIDANFLSLAERLVINQEAGALRRVVFATHDRRLIQKITAFAAGKGVPRR